MAFNNWGDIQIILNKMRETNSCLLFFFPGNQAHSPFSLNPKVNIFPSIKFSSLSNDGNFKLPPAATVTLSGQSIG